MKKIPLRKCVVTQEQLPKKDLLRVVKTPENKVVVDPTGRMNGRGAYIKKDLSVVELAKKKKSLERSLEIQIDESLYDDLVNFISHG